MPLHGGAALADGGIEGTDGVGHAIAEYPLGTLSFGAKKITVYAYWSSEEQNGKSSLGYGWCIPWFESRIYPVSRDCLVMHSPDGIVRKFWLRKEERPGLWRGRRGSGCVTSGGETRFYWRLEKKRPDLVFRNGRLVKMNFRGKTVEFRYSANGTFEQMICGGDVWCRMKVDGKDVIEMITLTDATYATLRGAKVGDALSSLTELYGADYFDDGYITYSITNDPADIQAERIQFEPAGDVVGTIYIYSPSY